MAQRYDRKVEDLGNIVALEHVNVRVPDQQLATVFYVTGLGLTRDPYIMTGTNNMWINIGRSQFHLPTGKPQVVRGHAAIVVPDLEALGRRLAAVEKPLEGTRFAVKEHNAYLEVTSPWGNRIRCFAPDPRFGPITLGLPYVELEVPKGYADGIAAFYRGIFGVSAKVAEDEHGRHAAVPVGQRQQLIYREKAGKPVPYDGHHIQIYIADFAGPYEKLRAKGLISEESDQHQYRFQEIVELESGKPLFTLEHEVRSMRHPLYNRPLVNRNPAQTNMHYAPGHDAWNWNMAHAD